MPAEKILVLNATGKVGRNVCRALREAGYEVYGTTRSSKGTLAEQGVKPVVCNYTVRADLDRAFADTGARKVFVITDYFGAAKKRARPWNLSKGVPPLTRPKPQGCSIWCS